MNINSVTNNGVLNDKNYYGYEVICSNGPRTKNNMAPALNNSIFQVVNKEFLITPNGRISSDESIVVVIGSKYHTVGAKILNCLVIQTPTGHILKGKFTQNDWITNNMEVSQKDNNNILTKDKCEFI